MKLLSWECCETLFLWNIHFVTIKSDAHLKFWSDATVVVSSVTSSVDKIETILSFIYCYLPD